MYGAHFFKPPAFPGAQTTTETPNKTRQGALLTHETQPVTMSRPADIFFPNAREVHVQVCFSHNQNSIKPGMLSAADSLHCVALRCSHSSILSFLW
jgi:hypothetical protein